MSARHTTPTLLRRLVALACLGAVGVLVLSPAASAAEPTSTTLVKSTDFDDDALARRIAAAESEYRLANENVVVLSEHSARLTAAAEEATAEAERLYAEVRDEEGGGIVSSVSRFLTSESDLDRAGAAADDAERARDLAELAADAVAAGIVRSEQARLAWETELAKASHLSAKQAAQLAAQTAARQSRFRRSYRADSKAEDALNHRALDRWLAYLDSLADAAIVPPNAQALRGLRLGSAGGFEVVRDATGRAVPGVAELDEPGQEPVRVLPAETIRAVSEAFSRVGLPDGAAATGPVAYTCGGLLAASWSAAGTTVPADSLAQWRKLHIVPERQLQVGDVIVLGSRKSGLTGSGVYLGDDLVIASKEETGHVAVRRIEKSELYGARRATLVPLSTPRAVPAAANCGFVAPVVEHPAEVNGEVVTDAPGPLRFPVADGSYSMSAGFGDAGSLWSSGSHTGQDFSAPIGTPVYASADGVVSLETNYWAGTLVRIDHGAGVETWYAHMDTVGVTDGQTVSGGDAIGTVGTRGNSTGPHLHFELRLDGYGIDPMAVLAPTSFSDGGAFVNGAIPDTALCAATVGGIQSLRCDAAVAFRMMSADYATELGTELCITDSYRSRDVQERVYLTKPTLAAVPGTSNHGWGVAIDLCGGIERFDTPEHEWLVSHGPSYGWIHPTWAAENGSRPEPWHFEYAG
jgi:murein DD-endopeptidase MepM/ murein hydrolase activator NlpD